MEKPPHFHNKIFFTSLGCARNLVDSEVMLGILTKSGYEIIDNEKKADFLVVNTCGFLQASREESLDVIGDFFTNKKASAKVIVTGCMAQKFPEQIREKYPEVHALLGSGDADKILEAIQVKENVNLISSAKSYLQWGEIPRLLSTPKHYAYLKIAEGCLKRCSFCIIPDIKGNLKSKPEEQVVKEFEALLHQGVYEIILIAQDLGDYGKERKEKGAFAKLIKRMLLIKKDFWLRFLYLYPDEIDDELIDIMKSDKRICPYLDMPLQHCNNDILRAMRRKTSKEDIISILTKLRAQIPHIIIRTSLMVGFPGETEKQFEELCQFVQDYPLDNVGVFQYSKEKDSFSAKLQGHLSAEIKQRRFDTLMSLQQEIASTKLSQFIGKTISVLVESYHPETEMLLQGRHVGQCPDIDGIVIINDFSTVDEFSAIYKVKISDIAGYDLIGKVVAKEKSLHSPSLLTCTRAYLHPSVIL